MGAEDHQNIAVAAPKYDEIQTIFGTALKGTGGNVLKIRIIASALLVWGSVDSGPAPAAANPIDPSELPSRGICTTFDASKATWGSISVERGRPEAECPEGRAVMSSVPDRAVARPAARIGITGACCELPPRTLTGPPLWVAESCPEGFVVTGVRFAPDSSPSEETWNREKELRCTRIDPLRFRLGGESAGVHVDNLSNFPDSVLAVIGLGAPQIGFKSVPPALRVGAGRIGFTTWLPEACVGMPWGALLVAKHGFRCGQLAFRSLEYTGAPGDPPAGTPVQLISECDALDDPFSATPRCLRLPTTPIQKRSE